MIDPAPKPAETNADACLFATLSFCRFVTWKLVRWSAEPPTARMIQAGVILLESADVSFAAARIPNPTVELMPARTDVTFGPKRSRNNPANNLDPIEAANPNVERTAIDSCCPEQKTPHEQASAKTPSFRRIKTRPGKPKTSPPTVW